MFKHYFLLFIPSKFYHKGNVFQIFSAQLLFYKYLEKNLFFKDAENTVTVDNGSKAIIEVLAFSLFFDVSHEALSETLSIVICKLDNVIKTNDSKR